MAQFDFAEKAESDEFKIESTDVMTGDRNRNRFLYYQLKVSISRANKIDIIVSFLMESGVRMLLKDLKAALDRDVQVRILTGNYLGITQPSALCLIKKELGNRVDLRFYNDKERSFHPKSYIFHYENAGEIYIGSSNISRSALTSGIEWNYRFNSLDDKKNFALFYDTFVDLFENHSIVIDDEELKRYSKNWHKPAVSKDLAKYDNLEDDADTRVEVLFQPRGAQVEALYALRDSRQEGATKGLVQASKAKNMPVKFLKASGKGFFIEKEGYAIAIRADLKEIISNEAFKNHMKDILEYRTMEYYRRRYRGE